jgi:hypothetical protein
METHSAFGGFPLAVTVLISAVRGFTLNGDARALAIFRDHHPDVF